mmetsp:Transcript_3097/g.5000  ORF Transcript_3097/g.5000 Transcript_3097/m.5000 type:complete len:130 (+) Transcript_3097:267-656(+)
MLDGASACWNALTSFRCERGISECHKIVTSNYEDGKLTHWRVQYACGRCPYDTSEISTCELQNCFGAQGEAITCNSQCFWKSEQKLVVARCFACNKDKCNISARRMAHHVVTLSMFGVFLTLLLRKCRV